MLNEALDEKYLHYIANNRNVSIKEANVLIDKCIKHLSATYNIDYKNIYNVVFSEEGLKYIIEVLNIMPIIEKKPCNQLSMQACIDSNTCFFLEPYGCLSREFPDVDLINENPDKYIKEKLGKTEDLKRAVAIASYLYHNFDSKLTDNAFDSLQWYLNQREKIKGRALEKIGAPVIEKLKITLLYPLPSLNKVYPGTAGLLNYLRNFKDNVKQCNYSLKLDGVSAMLIYENEKLVMINSRGDGLIGGNLTYLKDYVNVPLTVKANYLVVRGEFIISKDDWENKYKGTFSNARAFVSGKINSGYLSSALQDIKFIPYEIMRLEDDKYVPSTSQGFKILKDYGFEVVDNNTFKTTPTMFELMQLYKDKRLESNYYIDGLVLKIDEKQLATPKASDMVVNPTYAVAFKMVLEEQQRWTKAINIEWNISRYGKYIPVVIYEAVYVEGSRLTRATGSNAKKIQDWNLGKNTDILVIRAGDVIPQIKDVKNDPNVIPIFPITEEEGGYGWHWDKSDIILNDIETNKEVKIKRIVHFFETIEIPRLKQKTIEKMYEVGYETPESIIKSSIQNMLKVKGIGIKSATQFYDNIRFAMTNSPPDRFLEATTSIKSGIGRTLLKQLFKEFPAILDWNAQQIKDAFKKKKVPGFGVGRIDNVSKNIPLLRAYLDSFAADDIKKSIANYLYKINTIKKNGYNPMINGKTFVLTQMPFTTDYELEDYIYDNNGEFSSTVTSKTEAVICGNLGTISKKMEAALDLKVKVLFLQEFSENYGINLKRFDVKL